MSEFIKSQPNTTMKAICKVECDAGPGPTTISWNVDTGIDKRDFWENVVDREAIREVLHDAFSSEYLHDRSVAVRFQGECPECMRRDRHVSGCPIESERQV